MRSIMSWQTPSFVEINMSAEIDGYQSDFGDRDPWDPMAPRAEARPAATAATSSRWAA
jgi:hypothetical protein